MKLSQNFSLEEFTRSQTASRFGIDNAANETVITNLRRLCVILEQVRALFGNKPIRVTSGYRCEKLNQKLNSSSRSQHLLGCAADFVIPGKKVDEVVQKIMESDIAFDQVISEFATNDGGGWIHISIANSKDLEPRLTALRIDKSGTKIFSANV